MALFLIVNNKKYKIACKNQGTLLLTFWMWLIYQKESTWGTGEKPEDFSFSMWTMFCSSLPLPPANEHSDIYLQLFMWNDYHVFLIAPLVTTRLLINEIYHLFVLPFDWLMRQCYFLFTWWLNPMLLLQQLETENWWIWTR